MSKLRVGLVFGGISTEHEVSVTSATTIANALDPSRYDVRLIGLDHDGSWRIASGAQMLPEAVFDSAEAQACFPTLHDGLEFLRTADGARASQSGLDVVFPIVHGRGGEDGGLQGVFEMAEVPYVGPNVLSTALCMDKTASKRVLRDAELPVVPSVEASRHEILRDPAPFVARIEAEFAYPVFVKPTNTGSSVGVHRAAEKSELLVALADAARYDHFVLVEPGIDAREIECAVLGGHDPQASVLGEIGFRGDFYDYEAKYVSDSTELVIPAPLETDVAERMRDIAVASFRALRCWGLARVDFFLDRATESIYVNELNTLPGFTDGSMYPRLWDAAGIALPELVDRLIELALERGREQSELETRYSSE